MSDAEKDYEKDSSVNGNGERDINHVENGNHALSGGIKKEGVAQGLDDPSYVDHRENDDRAVEAIGKNSDKYDGKYWLSVNYIGTLFAIGMAFMGGIGGYGLIAPILDTINKDIGPSDNINWVPLANVSCGAVFFLLVGQLSDILGRRWFFIVGSTIALIGSIVGATAKDVNTLIAAETLIGIAVAFQQSFFWVVAEIVPMKYRYFANSYCYAMTTPTSPLAARVAFSFLTYPGTWRNCFYFLIAINAVSVLSWFLFYHPPTFSMLHRKRLARDLLLKFDWIGVALFSGGLFVFIFGLNWGGVLYPWNSPNVIATTIVGGVTLFFILPAYEIFASKRGQDTYLPLHLFKNIRFMSAGINTGTAAGVYYGLSLVFPQVVTSVYFARGEISMYDVGTLAGLAPMAYVFAQMCHGFVVWVIGPKWAMISFSIVAAALLAAIADDVGNRAQTEGLLITGAYAMGIVESVAITTSTFPLRSQEEIGQGGGLSGSLRNFISAISLAVYTATLNNRLDVTVPKYVYPVLKKYANFPMSSYMDLIDALGGKIAYTDVPKITPAIQSAVQAPYQQAFIEAASTVFLVTLAFSGPTIILSLFTTNNDKSTENYVAGGLHTQAQEKEYRKDFQEERRASLTEGDAAAHATKAHEAV